MLFIHRFKNNYAQLYGIGKMGSFFYQQSLRSNTNQFNCAKDKNDYAITVHRDYRLTISKGFDPLKSRKCKLRKLSSNVQKLRKTIYCHRIILIINPPTF
jgi:TPP-dependent pyruvate/acetoin dehydrogenase alpha subunit